MPTDRELPSYERVAAGVFKKMGRAEVFFAPVSHVRQGSVEGIVRLIRASANLGSVAVGVCLFDDPTSAVLCSKKRR